MRQRAIQLFALLGISLSPFAVGQQPTTPSPADRTAEISVRGCVSGEKRYTFMQASTGAEFELVGETDRFDHCVFTVRNDFPAATENPWLETLYSMRYDNPAPREMMDMEGLKAWLPGRTLGFAALSEAVQRQRFFEGGG